MYKVGSGNAICGVEADDTEEPSIVAVNSTRISSQKKNDSLSKLSVSAVVILQQNYMYYVNFTIKKCYICNIDMIITCIL